jgi:hypothetical protein
MLTILELRILASCPKRRREKAQVFEGFFAKQANGPRRNECQQRDKIAAEAAHSDPERPLCFWKLI